MRGPDTKPYDALGNVVYKKCHLFSITRYRDCNSHKPFLLVGHFVKYGVFLKRLCIARVLLTSNSGKMISKLNTNSYFKSNLD